MQEADAVGVLHYGDLEAGWDRRPRLLDGIGDQKAARDLVHHPFIDSSMRSAFNTYKLIRFQEETGHRLGTMRLQGTIDHKSGGSHEPAGDRIPL